MSREYFSIEDQAALQLATATTPGLLQVFLCGLCNWLVGLAMGHRPPTKVEVKSVIGYRVDKTSEHEDLISLALLFTPTFDVTGDPIGLASQLPTGPDECEITAKALKRVAKRKDVDFILNEDAVLNGLMIDATAELLRLARYDSDAYREWVQAH
jgi:hypothetical protein